MVRRWPLCSSYAPVMVLTAKETSLNGPKRRTVADVTFKGGLTEPFHRWFRLTPSFSPTLVADWLASHPVVDGGVVLDPFSGAGTTCIVASAQNMRSVGFEINPFLAFVGRVSTNWTIEPSELSAIAALVLAEARQSVARLPAGIDDYCSALKTTVPGIHNIGRWWRTEVLRELIGLRQAIRSHGANATDHLLLALAQCVYPTAEITLGRLQIAFKDRSSEDIDAFAFFQVATEAMVEDLENHRPTVGGSVEIINSDSRMMSELGATVGGVFCSPPYPNRYSYVWNTRPHLYLLELISTARAAADIDCVTIGGTWGRATSDLQRATVEASANVKTAIGGLLDRFSADDLLMRNYICKYFNDLDSHLSALYSKLLPGSPLGYVVGNTETKGIMVQTQDILGQLMDLNGLEKIEIEELRARNSGAGLVESTVSARRPG